MFTLYHAVWALAAIALYVLIGALARRQSAVVRRLLAAIGVSVAVYLPWGIYAIPQFLGRAARRDPATNIGQQFPITYFIAQGIRDLTMSQQIGGGRPHRHGHHCADRRVLACAAVHRDLSPVRLLALPALMIGFHP